MLSAFLETTSIHGLRYLGRGQGVLSRLVWFACITASFTAAVVIIYYNVLNWDSSPSVITQAQPMLVRELDVPLPTITVCPRNLDLNSLVVAYFDGHYNHTEKASLDKQLKQIMVRNSVERVASENKYVWTLTAEWRPAMEKCVASNSTDGDPCQLVLAIGSICSYLSYYIRDDSVRKDFVVELVVKALLDKTPLTLEAIGDKYKSVTNLDLKLRSDMQGGNSEWWQGVLHFYSIFHSVKNMTDEDTNNGASFEDLIGLDEFNRLISEGTLSLPKIENNGHMGSLFGHLINVGMKLNPNKQEPDYDSGVTKLILDAFVGDLVTYLGMEGIQSGDDLMEFLSFYSYDPEEKFFARQTDATPGEIIKGCNTSTWKTCEQTSEMPKACQDYCQLVEDGRKAEGFIKELFGMATGKVNWMNYEPRSMLPDCSWNKDKDCWTKVVTDRGLCFTDYYRIDKVCHNGRKYGVDFMLDKNRQPLLFEQSGISNWESYFEGVDVILTSRGDFALGRLYSEGDTVIEVISNIQNVYDAKIVFSNIVRTTPEFRAMAPHKRNCLYSDEVQLDFFPVYSESNCMLECTWTHAAQTCQCVPWFLVDHFSSYSLCEVFGNQCFKTMVDNRFEEPIERCQKKCPHDCEITEFSVDSTPTYHSLKILCKDGKKAMEVERKSICGYVEAKFDHDDDTADAFFVAKKMNWDNVDLETKYFRVYVNRKTTTRVLVTATVSIIDMISNIGGTLGLFSGFSILSGIELLYWAAKILKKTSKGKKDRGQISAIKKVP